MCNNGNRKRKQTMTYTNELTGFEELTDFEYLEEVSEILSGSVKSRNQDGIRFYRDWSGAKYFPVRKESDAKPEINVLPKPRHWI